MNAELLRLVAAGGLLSSLPVAARDGLTEWDVSPGVIGFLVTLALVLACIPLFRSMSGKLRGVQHRDLAREAGAAGGPASDEVGPAAAAGTGRRGEQGPGDGPGTGSGSDAG